MSKVLIIGALPASLLNFRKELLIALVKRCSQVIAMANDAKSDEIHKLRKMSVEYEDYRVSRNGLDPLEDLKTFRDLVRSFRVHTPTIVLAYTIKPIIWGGIAARVAKVPSFYAMVTGLGFAFQPGSGARRLLTQLVKLLYKTALKSAKGVIFQNPDNMEVFIEQGIVPRDKCFLVNGSGVNLRRFSQKPLEVKPHFLLTARLLGDKGIREYAQAAEMVKRQYPHSTFELVGPEDPSPDGIPASEVEEWMKSGAITYRGATSDVRPYIESSSIFVLPSYHEGLPRTVLEAMAMGRPILTTDVPGCRETVVNGKNGWLVDKANALQLAERMIWFIENPSEWQLMGETSRQLANDKFDVHKINADILKIMGLSDEKTV